MRDLLSPPPGYKELINNSHEFTYSMGRKKLGKGVLVLFEFRGFDYKDIQNTPAERVPVLMAEFAKFAEKLTGATSVKKQKKEAPKRKNKN